MHCRWVVVKGAFCVVGVPCQRNAPFRVLLTSGEAQLARTLGKKGSRLFDMPDRYDSTDLGLMCALWKVM